MRSKVETKLVHLPDLKGECHVLGSLVPPIFQTSTFLFDSAEQGGARFAGDESGYIYSRLGNPTIHLLEDAIAELEGAEAGLAFASGMAAISAILTGLVKTGDHVLVSRGIYGCTFGFLTMLKERFGVQFSLADLGSESAIREAIKPNTTVIYVESPVNPTMELMDIQACSKVAKEIGAKVVVDNTFLTPILQHPIELGADIVVHSATKYLGGHGDLILGVAVGPKELMDEIRMTTMKDIGGIAAPFEAWLVLRGLKTLAIRMERHVIVAKEIGKRLANHPCVEHVYYPGLPNFPQAELCKSQMLEPGAMISFIIRGGVSAGTSFMNALALCRRAVSLGEASTLVQHPASMTHSPVPADIRHSMGIDDGLIRLSVGLEDVEDIWEDLNQALYVADSAVR